MAFINTYIKEILGLEVVLFHARSRLEAETDSEALHDLRIAVRRIRRSWQMAASISTFNTVRFSQPPTSEIMSCCISVMSSMVPDGVDAISGLYDHSHGMPLLEVAPLFLADFAESDLTLRP